MQREKGQIDRMETNGERERADDFLLHPQGKILLELCWRIAGVKDKREIIQEMRSLPLEELGLKGATIALSLPWGKEEVYRVPMEKTPSTPSSLESQEEWTFHIKTEEEDLGKLIIFPKEGKREWPFEKELWNTITKVMAQSILKMWREKELTGEIKSREEELEEVVRELKRNREIQNIFMKRAAHELRTPLHSIMGFTQILLEENRENLPSHIHKYLDLIMEKAKEMQKTIDDITLLWDMRGREKEIEPRELDLPLFLEGILETLGPSILEKGLKVTREIKISKAVLDREMMARAIYHLVSNAVKFTPPGGEIRIEASPTPGGLGLSVCDTGIGIPPQHMEEIWEPFKQLEDPLTRRYPGMGVGLSLVRQIVEAHGGEVWVERGKKGKGTCFTMVIPQPPKNTGGNYGREDSNPGRRR